MRSRAVLHCWTSCSSLICFTRGWDWGFCHLCEILAIISQLLPNWKTTLGDGALEAGRSHKHDFFFFWSDMNLERHTCLVIPTPTWGLQWMVYDSLLFSFHTWPPAQLSFWEHSELSDTAEEWKRGQEKKLCCNCSKWQLHPYSLDGRP